MKDFIDKYQWHIAFVGILVVMAIRIEQVQSQLDSRGNGFAYGYSPRADLITQALWDKINGDTSQLIGLNQSQAWENFQLFENHPEQTHSDNNTWATSINSTTSPLKMGQYEIAFSYQWRLTSTTQSIEVEYSVDGGTNFELVQRQEPKDNAVDQFQPVHVNFYFDVATAETRNVILRFRPIGIGTTAALQQVHVSITRKQ